MRRRPMVTGGIIGVNEIANMPVLCPVQTRDRTHVAAFQAGVGCGWIKTCRPISVAYPLYWRQLPAAFDGFAGVDGGGGSMMLLLLDKLCMGFYVVLT